MENISKERYQLLDLPNELLLLVAQYLCSSDLVNFALTCKRFACLFRGKRSICIGNSPSWGFSPGVSVNALTMFWKQSVDPNLLTECNFNNCYWIPARIFQNFLVKCCNLQKLFVAETKLTVDHLMAHVFPKCKKVTSLSVTLSPCDWHHAAKALGTGSSSRTPLRISASPRMISPFSSCAMCDRLNILKELELVWKCSSDEVLFFIGQCSSLESLTLVGIGRDHRAPVLLHYSSDSRPKLKSLVAVGHFPLGHLKLFDCLCPSCSETAMTIWVPVKAQRSPLVPVAKYLALGWTDMGRWLHNGEGEEQQLGRVDLSEAECLYTPHLMYADKRFMAPQLKQVACYYRDEKFPEFCQLHPLIEVLQLGTFHETPQAASRESWNSESWECLAKLKSLSLSPWLIMDHSATTMKRKQDEEEPLKWNLSLFAVPLLNCPLIQELELGFFDQVLSGRQLEHLNWQILSVIAKCSMLKKLSLSNLGIKSGRFLEEVLRNCRRLESLRLNDLGPPGLCCYTENLCAAIPHARNLKTLSIFQRNVVPMWKVLDALETCSTLVQLGLVTPSGKSPFSWNYDGFPMRLLGLCQRLPNLVALFFVFSSPKSHCSAATKLLNQSISAKRPAFRADVQTGNVTDTAFVSEILPVIHQEVLVKCTSQVGVFPFNHPSCLG